MCVRNPKGTNSKRNPQWYVERVKEVVTSPAEEGRSGMRDLRGVSVRKGW